MDILTFISSILGSIAWPITIILLSFLFRHSISKILNSIRLKRVKRGDLEVDFEQDLSQLKEKADVVTIPATMKKSRSSKKMIAASSDRIKVDNELQLISQLNPAAGIALAWSQVEKELMSAIMRLNISPDYPANNSALQNIQLLKAANLINEEMYDILNRLRMLRNAAVHTMYDPSLTIAEAEDYATIAEKAVRVLSSLTHK
jgi:hypothetical protein